MCALQWSSIFLVNFMSMNLALGFHSITYNDDNDDDDDGLVVDRNHNSTSIYIFNTLPDRIEKQKHVFLYPFLLIVFIC